MKHAAAQLTFALPAPRRRPMTREQRWAEFHAAHPEVYRWLRDKAMSLLSKGRDHYGMRALWEVLRFHTAMGEVGGDFKLNDHYPPFYARLLMKQEPELRGFFEIRGDGNDWGVS